MSTVSLELTSTFNESLARRSIGDRYYAGLPSTGYVQQIITLTAGQQRSLTNPPTTLKSLVVAVDMNTTIVLGIVNGGSTIELPINELSIVTPPTGAQLYLRNTAAQGTPDVPCKLLMIY